MIQWRKIISFDFHHIPKLSIGFKDNLPDCKLPHFIYQIIFKKSLEIELNS